MAKLTLRRRPKSRGKTRGKTSGKIRGKGRGKSRILGHKRKSRIQRGGAYDLDDAYDDTIRDYYENNDPFIDSMFGNREIFKSYMRLRDQYKPSLKIAILSDNLKKEPSFENEYKVKNWVNFVNILKSKLNNMMEIYRDLNHQATLCGAPLLTHMTDADFNCV